ncbi:uncharacterized protein LOC130411452 [Triplophysa dalaica]|uniref:uncharacterized protein LOC130411452 n=1 Tax=Triplophysa dalaica TaxID=1582913 RepID=UPI0024DF7B30|nr:uncharacterized protein LOC130411452 [Triplophysa dalaica]
MPVQTSHSCDTRSSEGATEKLNATDKLPELFLTGKSTFRRFSLQLQLGKREQPGTDFGSKESKVLCVHATLGERIVLTEDRSSRPLGKKRILLVLVHFVFQHCRKILPIRAVEAGEPTGGPPGKRPGADCLLLPVRLGNRLLCGEQLFPSASSSQPRHFCTATQKRTESSRLLPKSTRAQTSEAEGKRQRSVIRQNQLPAMDVKGREREPREGETDGMSEGRLCGP